MNCLQRHATLCSRHCCDCEATRALSIASRGRPQAMSWHLPQTTGPCVYGDCTLRNWYHRTQRQLRQQLILSYGAIRHGCGIAALAMASLSVSARTARQGVAAYDMALFKLHVSCHTSQGLLDIGRCMYPLCCSECPPPCFVFI